MSVANTDFKLRSLVMLESNRHMNVLEERPRVDEILILVEDDGYFLGYGDFI